MYQERSNTNRLTIIFERRLSFYRDTLSKIYCFKYITPNDAKNDKIILSYFCREL